MFFVGVKFPGSKTEDKLWSPDRDGQKAINLRRKKGLRRLAFVRENLKG